MASRGAASGEMVERLKITTSIKLINLVKYSNILNCPKVSKFEK